MRDHTDGTHAARWFDTLVRNVSDLIAVVDESARLVYANPAAERILGFSPAEQAGFDMFDLLHPDDRVRAAQAFAADLATAGAHRPAAYRFRTASGEWRVLELVATNCLEDPAIAGIVVNGRDITERTYLSRALNTLSQGNQILVRATDEVSLLVDTCRMIAETGGYSLAWVGYAEEDDGKVVRVVAAGGDTAYLDGIRVTWGDDDDAMGPVGTAIRTGQAQVVDDISVSVQFAPWRERATFHRFRTVCALPLTIGGHTLGALAIYTSELGAFSSDAVAFLSGLAENLSYGISRLRDGHALEVSELRFRTLAVAAPIGIFEVASDGMVEYVNPRAAEIGGVSTEALKGRGWIEMVHPDDVGELLELVDNPRPDRIIITTTFRILRPDGEIRHVRLSATPKGPQPGSGYVVTVEDATEEVRAQEALVHQAFFDSLTGLPNRALLLDRLSQELVPRRHSESNIAVLFLDVDRLKLVNDSLGHEVGDVVLKEVAQRLQHGIRAGETVARFSGDEFVFILRDIGEADDAIAVAQRLLNGLSPPIRHLGHDFVMSASIGIVLPQADADPMSVIRDADTAMYHAKWSGGNRYALFDEDLHRRSIERFTVEGELRQALERGELDVYYQPIVEPATQRPVAAEALVRWHHPVRGLVEPEDFIAIAEDSGLIRPIGNWVFEQALAQLVAWDAEPSAPKLQVLTVNLSIRQLDDPGSIEVLRRTVQRYPQVAERVALEVTESMVMSDSATTRATLDGLRELGLRIAIDDFGTGYSSLAYLHSLPVTSVKIDRSFVQRLGAPDAEPVVRAIIDMSHAMGLRVTAEGVAEDHMRRMLMEMGCDYAQGYLWGPPVDAEHFVKWWQEVVRA